VVEINNLATNHVKNTSKNIENFVCNNCNKHYKERSGLWKHKQKCEQPQCESLNEIVNPEFIVTLLKQNNELQQQILELCKNGINNNSNNTVNSHNKTFNLQVFLNEQCKDAMNIMEFVDSIKLDLDDAESVRKLGYVNGISNIIIKHLKALDVHMRPVHCTDLKRETMYVKYQNIWEKQDADNKLIRKAIKHIAVKNYNATETFKELHPDCMDLESKYNDQFLNMKIEALGGAGNNNIYESHTKIIKKIAKEVTIDKSC
jgi:phage FluMu protein Com